MKRILAMAISLALIAAMAVGGSIAYLQDSDEAVNVMTLGNVYVELIEQQRDVNGNLEDFADDKNLYPAVYAEDEPAIGTDGFYAANNAVDKIVSAKNTGESPAYVRIAFAFEQGSMSAEDFNALLHINKIADGWNWNGPINSVEIEYQGKTGLYTIYYATLNSILESGAATPNSLMQVLLDKAAGNEEVAALDTDAALKYNILVKAQAVQAAGFDAPETALNEAFGAIDADNHPWKEEDASTVQIGDTTTYDDLAPVINGTDGITIKGNGAENSTLTADANDEFTADNLTISDLTIDSSFSKKQEYYALKVSGNGTTLDDVVVDLQGDSSRDRYFYGLTLSGSDITVKDSTIIGGERSSLFFEGDSDTAESTTLIDNCDFKAIGDTFEYDDYKLFYPSWGAGVRFQGFNGTVEVKNSSFESYGPEGYALDLGPVSGISRGNVKVSDTSITATSMRIGPVTSAKFTDVTIGNNWWTKLDLNGNLSLDKDSIENDEGHTYFTEMSFTLTANEAVFKNCKFTSVINFTTSNTNTKTITFDNCYYGNTLITAENVSALGCFTFSGNSSISYTNTTST